MTQLDATLVDPFNQPYPDEVEMGNKYRRAAANTPPGQQPQVQFEPLTARRAITHALTQNYQGEADLLALTKFQRGAVATKFITEQEPKLSPEEQDMVKTMTARLYAPLIVYQVWKAIGD